MHFIRAASSTIKSRNSSYSESHSSKKASFSLIRPRKFRIGLRNPLLSSRISPADTEAGKGFESDGVDNQSSPSPFEKGPSMWRTPRNFFARRGSASNSYDSQWHISSKRRRGTTATRNQTSSNTGDNSHHASKLCMHDLERKIHSCVESDDNCQNRRKQRKQLSLHPQTIQLQLDKNTAIWSCMGSSTSISSTEGNLEKRIENLEKRKCKQKTKEHNRSDDYRLPQGYARPMCHPNCFTKVAWDLIIGLLIVYSTLSVPFRIGFDIKPDPVSELINLIIDFVFIVDILVSFRAAYFDEDGELVVSPQRIAMRYFKGWFVIDLISSVPLDGIAHLLVHDKAIDSTALSSAKLLRFLRLASSTAVDVILMLLYVFYIAHVVGCIWHWLGVLSGDEGMSWITRYGIQDKSLAIHYFSSIYWAITTMTTVGYGDVIAANDGERALCLLGMLIGVTGFGYTVGNVSIIMESFNLHDSMKLSRMNELRAYISCRKEIGVPDENVLQTLPMSIQYKLLFAKHHVSLGLVSCFQNQDPHFIANLLPHLIPCTVSSGDVLYFQKEICSNLYIIVEGALERFVSYEGKTELLDCILQGSIAGVHASGIVMKGETQSDVYPVTCIAVVWSELYAIGRVPLIEALKACERGSEYFRTRVASLNEKVAKAVESISEYNEKKRKEMEVSFSNKEKVGHSPSFFPKKAIIQDKEVTECKTSTIAWADCRNSNQTAPNTPINSETNEVDMTRGITPLQNVNAPTLDVPTTRPRQGTVANRSRTKRMTKKQMSGFFTVRQTLEMLPETYSSDLTPEELLKWHWMIHPDSTSKAVWGLFTAILIIASVLEEIFRLGFNVPSKGGWVIYSAVVDMCFVLDLIISVRTAYWNENSNLVISSRAVALNYVKTWFFIDLASIIPFDLLLKAAIPHSEVLRSAKLIRAMRLVRVIKILRMLKMSSFFESLELALQINPGVVRLIKLIVLMSFAAHINACIWYATGVQSGSESWINESCMVDSESNVTCVSDTKNASRYLASIYWAFTTITSVGYGEIAPQPNVPELLVATISMVTGAVLFAHFVGTLVDIVLKFSPEQYIRKHNLKYLMECAADFGLTKLEKASLRNHMIYKLNICTGFPESEILSCLPGYLRVPAVQYGYRQMISSLPDFCQTESSYPGFISTLLPCMHPAQYASGEPVIVSNLAIREMHFIISGEAVVIPVETSEEEHSAAKEKKKASESNIRNEGMDASPNTVSLLSGHIRGKGCHVGAPLVVIPDHIKPILKKEVLSRGRLEVLTLRKLELDELSIIYPSVMEEFCKKLVTASEVQEWVCGEISFAGL